MQYPSAKWEPAPASNAGSARTARSRSARRGLAGESDNFHFAAYGGAQWGALGLRAGVACAWHDIETRRSIAFPGFSDQAEAAYDAGTAQVFGEFGYRIDHGGFAFEAFANAAYVSHDTDGFAEDGGTAALTGAGGSTDTSFTTLGVRAASEFVLGRMKAAMRGMIGWRHAFGDVVPLSTHAFAGGEAVAGTPIGEDALVLEAGFDVSLSRNASLDISYSGQIASEAHDRGFRADLTLKF